MGTLISSNRKNEDNHLNGKHEMISSIAIKSQIERIVNNWHRSSKNNVLSSDIINIIIHKLYQPQFETAHQNHLSIHYRILELFNIDSKKLIIEHHIESQESKQEYPFGNYQKD